MRIGFALLLAAAAAIGALAWSFQPRPIVVTTTAAELRLVTPNPPADMRLGVIHTGSVRARALFAWRGGGWERREFGMDVVIVEHPQGVLLFDAGFGREARQHVERRPALLRVLSDFRVDPAGAVADQLAGASLPLTKLAGVVLTHAHADHVSGLADLPGVPVWLSEEERAFIDHGGSATRVARELGALNYRTFRYDSGPYWGFARSHDVFGDGTVVLVPAGGHTPGSTIAFIHTPDGKSHALIGDLAWQREGVEVPAERPWLSRWWADEDAAGVRAALSHLHLLHKAAPELIIVPAHDRRVMATLPPATRTHALGILAP